MASKVVSENAPIIGIFVKKNVKLFKVLQIKWEQFRQKINYTNPSIFPLLRI